MARQVVVVVMEAAMGRVVSDGVGLSPSVFLGLGGDGVGIDSDSVGEGDYSDYLRHKVGVEGTKRRGPVFGDHGHKVSDL